MLQLTRSSKNPILTPTNLLWENMLVFNPGATFFGDEIYLIYRAMSKNDQISRLGLATSKDGIHFQRQSEPVYTAPDTELERYGYEDCRVTKIDQTYYLLYTAATGETNPYHDSPWKQQIYKTAHIALSTTKDFKEFENHHVILPGIVGKDAALFPKKVNGEFWLIYRKEFGTTFFAKSTSLDSWGESYPVFDKRKGFWDSRRTGIGAPPIETEKGWLIFYHGIDDSNVYRLGVMFLDHNDPTHMLYRSDTPIFEPKMDYEKVGFVPNVVFSCGAIEKDGFYFIYYGAGDQVTCVATAEKKSVLDLL